MVGGGGFSSPPLPTPYADDPRPGDTSIERVERMLSDAEQNRLRWGSLVMWAPMRFWRHGFGGLIAIMAMFGILFPTLVPRSTIFVLMAWSILLLIALGPAAAAAEYALMGASLHNQHAKRRGRNLKAQPGSDRILDSLRDVRRNNMLHIILGLAAVSLLTFSTLTPPAGFGWNLTLMLTMVLGLAMTFHIIFTSESLDHLEDEEPFLTLHAPTHHPTQIHSTLSEVVATHLDPSLRLRWDSWRRRISTLLKDGVPEGEALEQLLYAVHLSQQELITRQRLFSEVAELYEGGAASALEDSESSINLPLLHRIVAHAKAWQPSFFHLIDRLQMDMLDNGAGIVNGGWRMDAECEHHSIDGQCGLFIFLHNQTDIIQKGRLEVSLPGGTPDSYMFTVDVPPCPSPTNPIPLINDDGGEDAMQWMPTYLDRTVVLWLKITWSEGISGQRQIAVSLLEDSGTALQSMILHTKVSRRIGAGDRRRRLRLRRARLLVRSVS